MKIVYHCFGGAHASPTASAIHLGLTSKRYWPSFTDFNEIPFFDQTSWTEHGRLIKAGIDSEGNEVYFMGRRNSNYLIITLITEFISLTGGNPTEYYFVDCMQKFNFLMVIGGYSSRALGWVKFGRPIVTFGTVFSFPILQSIVRKTKQIVSRIKG